MSVGYVCAWCRRPGATRKVVVDGDGSTESYRYYCSASHQANHETNQPRPERNGFAAEAASFFEIVKEANLDGWMLLGTLQYGSLDEIVWRVTLQRRTLGGATENMIEFAEDRDPRLAMLAAYKSTKARRAVDKKVPMRHATTQAQGQLSPAMEKRLTASMDALWLAVKKNGRTGKLDRDGGVR